jgi:hypothetical protein
MSSDLQTARPDNVRFCQSCARREESESVKACQYCGGKLGKSIPLDPSQSQSTPSLILIILLFPGWIAMTIFSILSGPFTTSESNSNKGLIITGILGWLLLIVLAVIFLA